MICLSPPLSVQQQHNEQRTQSSKQTNKQTKERHAIMVNSNRDDDDDSSYTRQYNDQMSNNIESFDGTEASNNESRQSSKEEPVVVVTTNEQQQSPSTQQQPIAAYKNSFFFRTMAKYPWYYLVLSLLITVTLSIVGMVVGNFSVAVDNAGWQSRGTAISERQTQVLVVLQNRDELATGDGSAWQELQDVVQPGWETAAGGNRRRRNLQATSWAARGDDAFPMTDAFRRQLQQSSFSGVLEGCDTSYYASGRILWKRHLWPVWKVHNSNNTDYSTVVRDICKAEQVTQAVLEKEELCKPCGSTGRCLPPYSLVFFARLQVGDLDFALSCEELADSWNGSIITECVKDIQNGDYSIDNPTVLPESCPIGFSPTMVDEYFGNDNPNVQYTSSIFVTRNVEPTLLYNHVDDYDRADTSTVVSGAYDTGWENFVTIYVDDSVGSDMILAMGSALITALAVVVHTKSIWITAVGLLQIILSFPLAYFVYTLVAKLEFFPFLNFIGVFVVFALGADDIFVATDKWKNARLENPGGSVEDIAAVALPDAAGAMLLTTITTAVAFFATAICPVAPLKCFAIFCGLLVVFDYFLCVLLVFPALCIYDRTVQAKANFCCSLQCQKKNDKPSLIRRILLGFYAGFHKVRWVLLVLCIAATVVSCIFAARLQLPQSSDVRLLKSSVQYEQAYEWRLHLLHDALQRSGGSPGFVMWGVTPADTGDATNPNSFSQLVLDGTFDPSTTAAQEYMLAFCDRFFEQEFADLTDIDYTCPMTMFHQWLIFESFDPISASDAYQSNCNGATGLPMNPVDFNACISAWTNDVGVTSVLEREGVVQVIYFQFQQRIRFDSPYGVMDDEWNLIEDWMQEENRVAPVEVNGMFHSSIDFWWYDTNGKMLQTAFQAAGIALGFSGLVVLVSSRSLILTLFSIGTIGYVLSATTALLVASGWTLGFLESICFAILIGISCDFVIHFGHAYARQPGVVSRHERTKYALVHMGPSILAAAFTTICAAVIMLFTVISFFRQFAQILFYTVLQATVGSFVVYLTLTDCLGPEQPTYTVDKFVSKCCGCRRRRLESQVPSLTYEEKSATESL